MKSLLSRLFALMLIAVIGLTGCSAVGPTNGLSGNYNDDTIALIDSLRDSISIPGDALIPLRPLVGPTSATASQANNGD